MEDKAKIVDFRNNGLPTSVKVFVRNGEAELQAIDSVRVCRKAIAYLCVGYSIFGGHNQGYGGRALRVLACCNDFPTLQQAVGYHEATKRLPLYRERRWRLDIAALFDVSVKNGTPEEASSTELVGVPLYAECLESIIFEQVEAEAIAYTGIAIRAGWNLFPSKELQARIMPSSCCYVGFLKG